MANSAQIVAMGVLTVVTVAALVAVIVWVAGDAAEHVTFLLSQVAPLATGAKPSAVSTQRG